MFLDYAPGDGEAKTGSGILGCKEWFKEMLHVLGKDTSASVLNDHVQLCRILGSSGRTVGKHNQACFVVHCLQGVEEQVNKSLLKFVFVALDRIRSGAEGPLEDN